MMEVQLCWVTLWRSDRSARAGQVAGLRYQASVKAHATVSAQALSLWVSTASASERTTQQEPVNQAESLSVSRWQLQVSDMSVCLSDNLT